MSLQCIVVEDDEISSLHLQQLIKKESTLVLNGSFTNVEDAAKFLSKQMIDLIFLDIEMPGANGFQLLDMLPYKPYVILVTAKTEYAFTAFQYSVTDYLKKPVSQPRFKEALEKINVAAAKKEEEKSDDIFIKADGKLIRLMADDVLFVEALGDYVKFVTDKKNYLSLATFKSTEEKLRGNIFLKVHRSYLINTKKITDIEDNTVIINKHVIPISKAHRKIVLENLNIL